MITTEPNIRFPTTMTLPEGPEDAVRTVFHCLYLFVFMTGYGADSQKRYLNYLVGPRAQSYFNNAIAFLRGSHDDTLVRAAGMVAQGLPTGRIPSNAIITLWTRSDHNDPMLKALSEWLLVCYGDHVIENPSVPVISLLPDGSVYFNTYVPSAHLADEELAGLTGLSPFWRWLCVLTTSYMDMKDAGDVITAAVIPSVALPLTPRTLTSYGAAADSSGTTSFPLPNLINTLAGLDVLWGSSSDTQLSAPCADRFIRVMWTSWLSHGTLTTPSARKPRLVSVWGPEGFVKWRTIATEAGCYNSAAYSRLQSVLCDLGCPTRESDLSDCMAPYVTALESLATEAAKVTDDDPLGDPDSYDPDADTSTNADGIDNTAASSGIPNNLSDASGQVSKNQNDNAIGETSSNTGTTALIQLDSGTGLPINSYLYRRAIMAVNRLLEEDDELTVDHDAREALSDWCRQWLWVADVAQTQKLVRELGLQTFVKSIKV